MSATTEALSPTDRTALVVLKTAPQGGALVVGDWLSEVRRRRPFAPKFDPGDLVDRGLVAVTVVDDCALYRLTEAGRQTLAAAHAPPEPVSQARAAGRAYLVVSRREPLAGALSVPCQHDSQLSVPAELRRRCLFQLDAVALLLALEQPRDAPTVAGAFGCQSPSCCRFAVRSGEVRRLS